MRLWPVLLAGALSNLLPGPPALTPAERQVFQPGVAADVVYVGPPRVGFPVIPVQVWGLRYGLDVVLESTHPDWNMHEYARVDLPSGPLWLAKDANQALVQTIIADVPGIESWVPEVPVPRQAGPVLVTDRSKDGVTDVQLAYTNTRGDAVDIHYQSPNPTRPSRPRNGNTMGHSRDSVAALLDLHLFRPGGRATINIGGKEWGVRRLFGLYPMKFLLAQTQGGLAVADYRQAPAADGFTLTRPGADIPWPTRASEQWTTSNGWVRRPGPVVSLSYHYTDGELDIAEAWQVGVDVPVTRIVFTPALPDVRRSFGGKVHSRFAADIDGQLGHGVGEVSAEWVSSDDVELRVRPTAPAWFANRPIDVLVHFDRDGTVHVVAKRVPA